MDYTEPFIRLNCSLLSDYKMMKLNGDAVVRLVRLSGTVDDAAHHGDRDVPLQSLEPLLDLLRERDEVDLRAAAGRAGDKAHTFAAQPGRFQNGDAGAHLLHGVSRERDADRISDALGKQRTDADGGADDAVVGRAGLRDADVQRIGGKERPSGAGCGCDLCRQLAVTNGEFGGAPPPLPGTPPVIT